MNTVRDVLTRPRLVDEVVRVLREKIVRGELVGGRPLLQADLASELGVSRTPLREAFRVLENDGLLTMHNNNRTVEVVTFAAAELREMYEIREVVDGLAARLVAARTLTRSETAEARRLLGALGGTAKSADPLRRVEAHAAFHSFFLDRSQNRRLRSFIPLVRTSSAALYLPLVERPEAVRLPVDGRALSHRDLLEGTERSHAAILDAVLEQDPSRAESAAREHIARTLGFVERFDEWRSLMANAASTEA